MPMRVPPMEFKTMYGQQAPCTWSLLVSLIYETTFGLESCPFPLLRTPHCFETRSPQSLNPFIRTLVETEPFPGLI